MTLGLVKYCALPTYSKTQENANLHPDSPNPASQIPRLALIHNSVVYGIGHGLHFKYRKVLDLFTMRRYDTNSFAPPWHCVEMQCIETLVKGLCSVGAVEDIRFATVA